MFKVGEKIKFLIRDKQKGKCHRWKRRAGEVIGVTDRFVIVKHENYRETYMLADFIDGAIKIEN